MLRGDAVKDDSGAYAVFTEQGLSVSQMTAAKVMVAGARQPGYAGQAADDAPRLPKLIGELSDVCSQMSKNAKTWLELLDLTFSGP